MNTPTSKNITTSPLRKAYWAIYTFLRHPGYHFRLGFWEYPISFLMRLLRRIVVLDGIRIRLGSHLSARMARELVFGAYEVPERKLLANAIQPNDVVLELGAGLGVIATFCALRTDGTHVHCYEANPALIPVIEETFRLNGCNASLHNAVLGHTAGQMEFFIEHDFWSSSTVRRSASSKRILVTVENFSQVVETLAPTLLIIDIEGGEASLLDEFSHLPNSVQRVLIELHPQVIGPETVSKIRNTFVAAGFSPVEQLANGAQVLFSRRTYVC